MSIRCNNLRIIGILIVLAVLLFPIFQADAAAVTRTLTIVKAGSGTGTVTATNIDCGLDCTEAYDKGTSVVLTAAPDADAIFKGWIYAGVLVSKNSTYTTKMGTNKTIKAKFLKTYNVTITNTNIGDGTGGSVTASGISCGSGTR